MQLANYSGAEALPQAVKVWQCYDAVFGDFDSEEEWTRDLFVRHASRGGYRLACAFADDQVVGFAWGYTGQRGQYWSDLVADSLGPELAERWVGGHFEFVELGVHPDFRRQGVGRQLHDRLLEGINGRALLASSSDGADAAVRLYEQSGWRTLGALSAEKRIMGRDSV